MVSSYHLDSSRGHQGVRWGWALTKRNKIEWIGIVWVWCFPNSYESKMLEKATRKMIALIHLCRTIAMRIKGT